ncbi:MAG TPA: hypothetical protein VIL30_22075 [Ramlibacter sp.]
MKLQAACEERIAELMSNHLMRTLNGRVTKLYYRSILVVDKLVGIGLTG